MSTSPEIDLIKAINAGDSVMVLELISAGLDPNFVIPASGETLLIRAMFFRHKLVMRLLVQFGADVNLPSKTSRAWTPLMHAHTDPELILELVELGADVNQQEVASDQTARTTIGRGETALHLAAAAGSAESVRALIQSGADFEIRAANGCTALDYAIRNGAITECAEMLVGAGAKLTTERITLMHSGALRAESGVATPTNGADYHSVSRTNFRVREVDEAGGEVLHPTAGCRHEGRTNSVPFSQLPAQYRILITSICEMYQEDVRLQFWIHCFVWLLALGIPVFLLVDRGVLPPVVLWFSVGSILAWAFRYWCYKILRRR